MSMPSSPIIGPPFTAQMMPSSLSPELRQGMAVFFNIDTLGDSYTPPPATGTSALTALLPQLAEPITNESNQYTQAIADALQDLKKLMNFNDVEQSLWNKERWIDTISTLQGLADLRALMVSEANQEKKLYQTQQSQILAFNSGALLAYNTALSQANTFTHAMYLNQQSYLSGQMTATAYNATVVTWNAQVGAQNTALASAYQDYLTAVTALNNQITLNNQLIQQLNQTRQSNHISGTIASQPLVTVAPAPTTMPTNLADGPVLPAAPSILPQDLVPSGYSLLTQIPMTTSISTSIDTAALAPVSTSEQLLFNQIQSALNNINNGSLLNYDTALSLYQSEELTMEQALLNYQKGIITTLQYNQARTHYLSVATTANTSLSTLGQQYIDALNNYNNNLLPGFNDSINTFNDVRKANNLPLIPTQDPLTVPDLSTLLLPTNIPSGPPKPTTDPFSGATSTVLPQVPTGSITPTNLNAFLTKYFASLFISQLAAFKAYTNILSLQSAYRTLLYLVLNGKTNTLPNNSYLEDFNQVLFNTPGGGTNPAAGPTTVASIVGLDNSALAGIISQAVFVSALGNFVKEALQPTTTTSTEASSTSLTAEQIIGGNVTVGQITDTLALVALQALQKSSLFAGGAALAALLGHLENAGSNTLASDALIALFSLKSIVGLIGSEGLKTNIAAALTKILQAAGLPSSLIAEIIKVATASVSMGVLLFGLLGMAKALSLPGLVGQVLGTQLGFEISHLIAGQAGTGLTDVLGNPVSVLFLKQALANQIESRSLSNARQQADAVANQIESRFLSNARQQAEAIANQAINDILTQRQISTELEFKSNLTTSLINQGVAAEDVTAAADLSASFVRGELMVRGLDAAFQSRNLDNQRLQNPLFYHPELQTAINNTLNQHSSFETIRQFRDSLATNLQALGKSQTEAFDQANLVAFAIQPSDLKRFDSRQIDQNQLLNSFQAVLAPNVAQEVVTNAISQHPASEQVLREALVQQLVDKGLKPQEAQKVVAQAVIVPSQTDLLKSIGNGQLLAPDQLLAQLNKEVVSQLKHPLGIADAKDLAHQFGLLIFGSPSSTQQEYINDVNNSASVIYQLKNALQTIQKFVDQKTVVVAQEQFSEFIKPSVSLLDLSQRYLDPANSLVLSGAWGLMYSGTNAEPSSFKKSIDVRI